MSIYHRWVLAALILGSFLNGFTQETASPPPPPAPAQTTSFMRYWKFHKWGALGYRRDRQQFNPYFSSNSNLLKSSLSYQDRNTLTLTVGSYTEWRFLALDFRGGYGWLLNGDANYTVPGQGQRESLHFQNIPLGAGYTANIRGTLGVILPLYTSPAFKMWLLPSGGYAYMHMMNAPNSTGIYDVPSPPEYLSSGTTGYVLNRFPKPNQQDWFGPLVEARLRMRFWDRGEWHLFYQYQKPSMRSVSEVDLETLLFSSPNTLSSLQLEKYQSVVKGGSLRTQLAGTAIKVHNPSGWTFGIHFEGFKTWSDTCMTKVTQTVKQYVQAPLGTTVTRAEEQTAVKWINYDLTVFMGYKF